MEYALILGVVTVALLGMQAYFKRGIQSVIKVTADGYGFQGEPVKPLEIKIKEAAKKQKGIETLSRSESISSWTQKIENRGEGNIRSEIKGENTVTGTSVWVGGDYRRRSE